MLLCYNNLILMGGFILLKGKLLTDENGLYYVNINDVKDNLIKLNFIHNEYKSSELLSQNSKYDFFGLSELDDYVLKICTNYCHSNMYSQIYLLKKFNELRNKLIDIDFPIGYVSDNGKIIGQVIKNYPHSISLRNASINFSLFELKSYFYRDDDDLHNLFLLYHEILNLLEAAYENNFIYCDVNPGNFLLYDNNVKLIDFENEYMFFYQGNYNIRYVLRAYLNMIIKVNCEYHLDNNISFTFNNKNVFLKVRKKVLELENHIRKS